MKSIDEKIAALLQRSLEQPSIHEVDEACERNLQTFLDAAANMKNQPADEPQSIEELGPWECLVLNAVYLLREEVTYQAVADKATELADTEAKYRVGTLMHTLVSRGLISRRSEPPSPDDVVQYPKTFFKITDKGIRTLIHARESQILAQDYRHDGSLTDALVPLKLREWIKGRSKPAKKKIL